jgi:hypothetical protein
MAPAYRFQHTVAAFERAHRGAGHDFDVGHARATDRAE